MSDIAALQPAILISGLDKFYGGFQALRQIELQVFRGEKIVVCGPSGSGKSTLIRCINRLEPHDRGRIVVNGIDVTDASGNIQDVRREVGMVFQSFNLFPHLTAIENVMLGLRRVRGLSRREAHERAQHWLARVGLADKLHNLPIELSGGQQQRVGIARAVAMNPKVLLLDEITSALDPELVGEVLKVVHDLARDGITMILVTHEMTFARDVSSQLLFMDEGRVAVTGTPQEVFAARTQHERLQNFLEAVSQP